MAGAVMGSGGGRRRGRRGRRAPMSEINVTPFVDVMLVLLIVFMVAAPLLTSGVPVDLPEASAAPLQMDGEPITITVNTEGKVFLKEDEIPLDTLVPRLMELTGGNMDERIYVRGDRAASYGTIMYVMGEVNGAGFRRIGLIAIKEQG